jgi:hypothetical protein
MIGNIDLCLFLILFISWSNLSFQISNFVLNPVTFNQYRKNAFIRYIEFQSIYVEFGDNLGSHVKDRLMMHLMTVQNSSGIRVHTVDNLLEIKKNAMTDSSFQGTMLGKREEEAPNILFLSFGNASLAKDLISMEQLEAIAKESFEILFNQIDNERSVKTNNPVAMPKLYELAVNGLPLDLPNHHNLSFNKFDRHYGAIAGSYGVLELLGMAFLHPLEPYYPTKFVIGLPELNNTNTSTQILHILESPYWAQRGFHLHTQHPIELTEVLQGHDIPQFGTHGPLCKSFNRMPINKNNHDDINKPEVDPNPPLSVDYCERWDDMVIDVDYFYEWSIANGLNMIEWLLLGNYKWGDELLIRSYRLKKLTDLGHQYSLLIGADVPIGNIQQHGWYMVNVRLTIEEQKQQIRDRVDWIFHQGFDFMTTESGLSEFTHPECDLMVDLFNTFAIYVNETWGKESATKVHCSTGQYCEEYLDPRTGDPINFNFLPSFVSPTLGIFPHTVQAYSFDDPTSGTYGNNNFTYMEDYLIYEAKLGQRAVLYYGETSYWVNVDIDVPLFLSIYGQRRQKDLRKIAIRESLESFHMTGQMNFDSGWEYGYWLNDVITARSSWDPQIKESNYQEFATCTQDAITKQPNCPPYSDEWSIYSISLQIYTKIYGSNLSQQLTTFLTDFTKLQSELLILSYINGRPNPNLQKLSGIAYLSGTDTWVDIPRLFGLAFTQPDKVHIKESDDPYWPYVIELLDELDRKFGKAYQRIEEIYNVAKATASVIGGGDGLVNKQGLQFLMEIKDSIELLSLRARQMKYLYESNDADLTPQSKVKIQLLQQSRQIIHQAEEIIKRREQYYRVPVERIASWRENPTVYRFGYLWSVHTLYYWWRDQGLAEKLAENIELSPCYLNRMDSTEVAVGWGKYTLEWLRYIVNTYFPTYIASLFRLQILNCLSPPSKEYQFPRDLGLKH